MQEIQLIFSQVKYLNSQFGYQGIPDNLIRITEFFELFKEAHVLSSSP